MNVCCLYQDVAEHELTRHVATVRGRTSETKTCILTTNIFLRQDGGQEMHLFESCPEKSENDSSRAKQKGSYVLETLAIVPP